MILSLWSEGLPYASVIADRAISRSEPTERKTRVRGESTIWRNADAMRGASSCGPSPRTCRSTLIPPDRASRSISNNSISVKVWMHIGLNGSSGCSATAIIARMTVSDKCTLPAFALVEEEEEEEVPPLFRVVVVPTSMMVRMSLMACSFSMACLLSRCRDLRMYQSTL